VDGLQPQELPLPGLAEVPAPRPAGGDGLPARVLPGGLGLPHGPADGRPLARLRGGLRRPRDDRVRRPHARHDDVRHRRGRGAPLQQGRGALPARPRRDARRAHRPAAAGLDHPGARLRALRLLHERPAARRVLDHPHHAREPLLLRELRDQPAHARLLGARARRARHLPADALHHDALRGRARHQADEPHAL